MKAIAYACACLFLVCGCRPENRNTGSVVVLGQSESRSPLLDALLIQSNAAARIKAAAQDFPGDEWRTHPKGGRYNVTRSDRASRIATELLRGLSEHLRSLSAQELLANLKTFEYGDYGTFHDAAYYVYLIGNSMIVDELGRKPALELEALRGLREDRRMIWNGDSGGMFTISDLASDQFPRSPRNGQPGGAANRDQPGDSQTNRTSTAAGPGG